jgi:tight adherence protein C
MLPFIFVTLTGACTFFFMRALTFRRLQVEATLRRIPGYGYAADSRPADARGILRRIGRIAPGGSGAAAEQLRHKIAAAGWSKLVTAEDLAGLTIVLPVCAYLGVVLIALAGLIPFNLALLLGIAVAAGAYVGLPMAVDLRVRGRRDKIVASMPTILDLLTLSVETGMSFDAGLQRLVQRMRGPLVDELGLMLRDMQLGTSRYDALQALANRVDAPEVTSFVRALTQADRLGVPLAQMLRTQADELRTRLRNEAEEQAMKAPVKMLFPTVLLIFPAVFIVVLGPAVLGLMTRLG